MSAVFALIGLLSIVLAVLGIVLMVIADAKDEKALDRFYRDKLYLPPHLRDKAK